MPLSFLKYFSHGTDTSLRVDEPAGGSIDATREWLAIVRAELMKKQSSLDLASRVAMLESQVADAAVVIETLIELLDERVGLPREEILTRMDQLSTESRPTPGQIRPLAEGPSMQPIEPKPLRLATGDEKDPFEPRRKWRDARRPV